MKTIIAGGRDIDDPKLLRRALKLCGWKPTVVLCGKATGVDTLGEEWALKRGIPVLPFPAKWKVNGVYDRGAGYKRNTEMSKHAEALLAIWDGVSTGTKHMIGEAKKRGLRVYVYNIGDLNATKSKQLFDLST